MWSGRWATKKVCTVRYKTVSLSVLTICECDYCQSVAVVINFFLLLYRFLLLPSPLQPSVEQEESERERGKWLSEKENQQQKCRKKKEQTAMDVQSQSKCSSNKVNRGEAACCYTFFYSLMSFFTPSSLVRKRTKRETTTWHAKSDAHVLPTGSNLKLPFLLVFLFFFFLTNLSFIKFKFNCCT